MKDSIDGYMCECIAGYTGLNCETNVRECLSNPCVHGYCLDKVNSYYCNCTEGFSGVNCETFINYCTLSPCVHGVCEPLVAKYKCSCGIHYSGINCDYDIRYGVWNQWSEYSACAKTCSPGLQTRQRSCQLEDSCKGDATATRVCSSQTCPGKPLFNNLYCFPIFTLSKMIMFILYVTFW